MDLVTPTTLFASGAHCDLQRWGEAEESRGAQAVKPQHRESVHLVSSFSAQVGLGRL